MNYENKVTLPTGNHDILAYTNQGFVSAFDALGSQTRTQKDIQNVQQEIEESVQKIPSNSGLFKNRTTL